MLGTITLTVGQTDAMPQKEDSPESVEVLQDEVAPQVNGEKEENECISADETTPTEEKVAEEKPTESNEVGFKKIFRFVGFKFTLKKDKNEKTEPVQLLTVKETEDGASEAAAEETKQEPVTAEIQSEDEKEKESPEMEKEASAEDAAKTEAESDLPATDAPAETKLDGAEENEKTPADEPAEEVETSTEKEKELEPQAESPTSPPSQETQSPLRRFFTQGIFSNLRKKTSFKKSKEEEPVKEKSVEEDIKEAEEKEEEAAGEEGQVKEDAEEVEAGEKVDKSEAPEKSEASPEEAPSAPEEQKEEELKVEVETTSETAPVQEPAPVEQITTCEDSEASAAEEKDETKPTDDTKLTDDKATDSSEEQQTPEKSPAETSTEAEIQSSQDKTKGQGSPLKKLFTGAGLKKLSSKKQKAKKETELKPTESTEQAAEQIQSSTESGEAQKPDSGASSPEESGEHVVGEASQADPSVEAEGEAATSDSEKKKDGILHWASFKKLVTPKKRVKKSSESEDEAPGDKPKSATLSSTESAVFEEKTEEIKSSDEVKEEAKEETQVECKTETKAEKFEQSTEEPKKKIDTSVSWEALICVGSAKKRARKTSDSDDEETKIEEAVQQSGEEQAKTAESPLESSQDVERENLASSPEPEGELVSTWESFKRLVTHRKKPKAEDKSDEAQSPEQAASDSELPKEESSFSLRKLIPRRKKKSDAKQGPVSSDIGSAEEDSDTPAVVPLSEYDNEQTEKATDEQDTETKTEDAKPEVTPVTPGKASAEDRSPSWISATVENVEDEAEGKPLSDIPEEGDTAATPKSTDNTIVEDIIEFTSEAITAVEPAEETEMVSALSRITESPVTSGETSPVPDDGVVKKVESILQEAVETTSITSSAVAVTVTEEQTKSIAVTSSPFQIESAIKEEKVVLAVHEKSEAVTICTGLDTSEIKVIEEESPLKATVEAVTTVSEALSVEVAAEDQTLKPEEAQEAGEKVFAAQINEVQTECKEQPKASVETTVEETLEVPTTNEIQEAIAVKVEVVTIVQQEMEILDEPVVAENTPKVVAESPVESTIEQPVYVQTGEITEVSVAKGEVQELKDVEESVASAEAESVEVAVAVSEKVTTSLADTIVVETTTMSEEDLIPVLAATEEHAVTREIVCVCLPSESKTEAEVMETVLPTEVHVATNVEVVSVSVSVQENSEVASSNVSPVIEEACKKDEEGVEAMHLKEAEAIQEQSTVIVQEVLQNVVENMGQELKEKPVEEIDTATPEEVPSAAEEEKSSQDAPVTEEKSTVDTQIQEETKPEIEDKAEEQLAQISIVRSPVIEAIQISETVLVAMTEEIKAQEEDVSSVSAEATQLCTDVKKQEVELKEDEKKLEEDKTVTTESKDGKCQVEKNQNEEPSGTTETPASEESSQMQTVTLVSTKCAQIVEEVQDTKIKTTTEIDVGIMHVVDAAERATQDTEIAVKEDSTKSQEPSKDVPQADLEEAQKDISTPDMKGKESSGDPDCQKTDAEPSEVKTAAEETPKATKEEGMEKKIDTITTETATES